MPITDAKEAVPSPEVPSTPLLDMYTSHLLSAVAEPLQDLAKYSILTSRRPNPASHDQQVLLPTVESSREKLRALCLEGGAINQDKLQDLQARAGQGIFFYADGVKIEAVSLIDSHLGDAYIASNLEILLKVAEKLDCDLVYGIYSGDENCGLLIPRSSSKFTGQDLSDEFSKTISLVSKDYFYDDPQIASFFKEAAAKLDSLDKELGMTIHTSVASEAKVHVSPKQQLRDRQIAAAIIDSTKPSIATIEANQIPLLNLYFDTLAHERRIQNRDKERYPARENYPPHLQALSSSALVKQPELTDSIEAYAELAVFEPIFPGELEVRKISTLKHDISASLGQEKAVRLFRFADTRLKSVNDQSHSLGDYHLIATARIVERALQEKLDTLGIVGNLHDHFKIYQHRGSFILTVDQEQMGEIADQVLNDFDRLNLQEYAKEQHHLREHEDPAFRAKPFIVGTSYYLDENNIPQKALIKNYEDLENLYTQEVEGMSRTQTLRETLIVLTVSGVLHQLIPEIVTELNDLLTQIPDFQADKIANFEISNLIWINLLMNIGPEYLQYRQNRAKEADEKLSTNRVSELHNLISRPRLH